VLSTYIQACYISLVGYIFRVAPGMGRLVENVK